MREIDIKLAKEDIWPPWYKRWWLTITFRRRRYIKKLKAVWTDYSEFDNHLDEMYAKAAAQGDRLENLSKKKRQEVRGVDMYRCNKCKRSGAPWSWMHDTDKNLDDFSSDEIPGVCPCGGVIVLIDD